MKLQGLSLRVGQAVLAACVAAVVVTVLEALGLAARGGVWPSGLQFAALLGLNAPVCLALGVAVGCCSYWIEPDQGLGLLRLRRLQELPSEQRAAFTVRAVVFPLALALSLVVLARLNLGLLQGAPTPSAAGMLGGAALGLGLLGTLAAAERLSRLWQTSIGSRVTPEIGLGVGVVLSLAALGSLVLLGETGGGRTAVSIWGVLRREELDLRLPSYLALVAALSYQLPAFGRGVRGKSVVASLLALGLAVGGLLTCADRATDDPVFSASVEQNAALAARPLGMMRALTDADHDGFAGRFGGGDCNDRDSAINPTAQDLPGNGVDEDCSGADLAVAPAAGAVAAAQAVAEPSAKPSALPQDMNVLLVTVDTLRYDLGYMGYERPVSPNIDKLAAQSTVYERAYALASYTSKSLAPMLIGRYGMETRRGWMHFNRYPPEDVMLQERVRPAGIRTLSVQGHWYFDERSGMGRGFDVLDLSAAPKVPQAEGDKTVNSVQITDAAIQHLRSLDSKQRFYMWVHYLDPHAEYVKHEEFVFGKNQRALYDGEIAFTDAQVGRLLDALRELPMAAKTAIVFTSDHGEAFSEHGMVRHGFELWEELVRVPLIVYVPGQAPRRYAVRRSAIDVVPTVLELLSLPIPSGDTDDFVRGTSLVSEVVGAPTSAPSSRPIFVDMPAGPYNGDRQAFIRDDLKLITSDSKPVGLYDLATDPGERSNLVADKARTGPALDDMKAFRSTLRAVVVKPK